MKRALLALSLAGAAAGPAYPQTPAQSIPVSGLLLDGSGQPRRGVVSLTVAVYEEEAGGTPLWLERHVTALDADGRYALVLGVQSGPLPTTIFAEGLARWLGVQADGAVEVRRPLRAVPYAVAAADTARLGGRAAAEFVIGDEIRQKVREAVADTQPDESVQVTPNRIPKFTSSGGAMDDSALTDAGGLIGLGTTTPNYLVQMHGAGDSLLQVTNAFTGSTVSDGTWLGLLAGDPTFRIINQEISSIEFFTNATRRLTVDAAGRVGLGVATPHSALQLHAAGGHALLQLTNQATGVAASSGSYVGILAADPTLRLTNQEATGGVEFFANGQRRLTIDPTGKLGIGTRTPNYLAHIATGAAHAIAQFANQVTPDPQSYLGVLSGQTALRIATSAAMDTDFYTGGVRRLTMTGPDSRNSSIGFNPGSGNTGIGVDALASLTTGMFNTAVGDDALTSNTTGSSNTALGLSALSANIDGCCNTGTTASSSGSEVTSLAGTSAGTGNTAIGSRARGHGTSNISVGRFAALNLQSGDANNIYVRTSGTAFQSNRIRFGAETALLSVFMAGIRGTTTGLSDAVPVVVDSTGQLGTIVSSRRYKEDIRDLGSGSRGLSRLRPVTFRYIQPGIDGSSRRDYGLIAEEVAAVFPDLVVYDADGRAQTVQYHELSVLMLNELQRQQRALDDQARQARERADAAAAQRARLDAQARQVSGLLRRLEALEREARK